MKMLYRFFFWVLPSFLDFGAVFSKKIRHFLAVRREIFPKLRDFREKNQGKLVWFHVASLGEYEQARPVISKWEETFPEYLVAVSFFSPSGYEPASKKPQPNVDFITYLPLDRYSEAQEFVNVLKPEISFFVKYDLWYNHIQALKIRNIPVFLISAAFRENQIYFSWFGGFFKKLLFQLDWIFTQNDQSIELLQKIGFQKVSKAGDTRFDRVAETASSPKLQEDIRSWVDQNPVVVVGSAWDEDMEILIPLINSKPDYRWIIAPHDLSLEPMDRWASQLDSKSKRYSQWKSSDLNTILFIDNIGMLSSLYQFAKIAYVGGAFGKGLHNILEPMGFGIPVIFGKVKKSGKFPEAAQSQLEGCGFEVSNFEELEETFGRLEQNDFYQNATDSTQNWVKSNLGAAERIVSFIQHQIK